MKKLFSILVLILTLFTGCAENIASSDRPEQPIRSYQQSTAVIQKIKTQHYMAGYAHMYKTNIRVWCEEYQLSAKRHFNEGWQCGYEKGDTIEVEICTVYMESTGEILDRFISDIDL